jgi:hypothetical protein
VIPSRPSARTVTTPGEESAAAAVPEEASPEIGEADGRKECRRWRPSTSTTTT